MILIAIGLAMDAFAVALCKGLAMKKICYVNVRETSYTKRFLEFFRKKIPKQMAELAMRWTLIVIQK